MVRIVPLLLVAGWMLAAPLARAQAVSPPDAVVHGRIEAARCDTAALAGASGAVDTAGRFAVRVPMDAPAYVALECGWRLPLFLAPGDDLSVTVAADGDVAYAGRGAAANTYRARAGGLVGRPFMEALYPLRRRPYPAFTAAWDSLRRADEAALDAVLAEHDVPAPFPALERARIAAVWAHGHLAYPVLHWRDGDAEAIRPTPGTEAAYASVSLNDPALLALPEFRAYARAAVHERARALLARDHTYQTGDNRWARAKYDVVLAHVHAPAVRDALLHDLLATHLDQNGSEGLEPLLARFAADVEDADLLRDLVSAYAEERRRWRGDVAEPYKAVGGTTLEAHVERPAGADPDARLPVLVWLHGGSFDTGAWYLCPYVCGAALEEGLAVVRLEQRTADRFHTTPADQLADVRDALAWLRRHADRLRLDPERVVLAGFSSGATLAVMASVLEEVPGLPDAAVPDAAVAVAACVEPLEGDGWFRKSIARSDDPARFSPARQVRPGAAPLLLVHGTRDAYCEYDAVPPFVAAMDAAGNDVVLTTLPEQPHFFLFRSPPSRRTALDAVAQFLRTRGLTAP